MFPPFIILKLILNILNKKLYFLVLQIGIIPGVSRHLAKSIGFAFSNPDAISEMIKDEQIKVKGCLFASSRGRNFKRRFASILLRVFLKCHARR